MRKLLVLVFTLLSFNAFAQLEVKPGSFREVPGFVNTNPDPNYQTDDNDLPFAVIKVRTENISDKQRKELIFEGNGGTFIVLEYKIGEVWVYLTARYADYLKISHPEFSSIEYTLPCDLVAKHGYELTLVNNTSMSAGSGALTVTTKPEDGAIVMLNGKLMEEKTPYKNGMIAAGHYEIMVAKDRYKSVTQTFDIQADENKKIEIIMPLDVAMITINADNLTDVYVDGKLMKRGTWIGELNSGKHDISLKKERFKTVEKTINVEGGKDQSLDFSMSVDVATITLNADDKTDVYIDGHLVKRGSWSGELYSGQHVVEYRKDYHRSDTQTITVVAGIAANYELHPSPIYGKISVSSEPEGAAVYIDGKEYGLTPLTIDNVIIGPHDLKIAKNDRKEFKKQIVLIEGNPLIIKEKLEECPTGAIYGVFSVSKDKKVYFSKGNLQYQPSTKTWRFADNQWETLGQGSVAAFKIVKKSDKWYDRFNWATSGYKGKDPTYDSKPSGYGDGGNDISNTNYDWGVYNAISNGGNTKNSWRTLTISEWTYVLFKRDEISPVLARVNGVDGVILLPDNWDDNRYKLSKSKYNSKTGKVIEGNNSYENNSIKLEDWTDIFETNGAVFLPKVTFYWSTSVDFDHYRDNLKDGKYYWKDDVYCVKFGLEGIRDARRNDDGFVRLVCDAE